MSRRNSMLAVLVLLPFLGGVAFVIYWWLTQESAKRLAGTSGLQPTFLVDLSQIPESDSIPEPEKGPADDLKQIEGIGPKISSVLVRAGIKTYAQLAVTDVNRLSQILREAGVRAAPGTWPEQARLAAVGDWEGLISYQDQLKGGRLV